MSNSESWKDMFKEEGFQEKPNKSSLLNASIIAFLHKHGQQLTNIQKAAIEPIFKGENAILISNTASGKTEAAVIPISAKLAESRQDSLCVYVAPTKALLNDLEKRLIVAFHHLGLNLGIRHGDRPINSTDGSLSLLLTTPESLDILISRDHSFLNKTKVIVCDEIHQIYGSPRGLHLLFLLNRLEKKAGRGIQRIALSATVGNPAALATWFSPSGREARVFSSLSEREIDAEFHWLSQKKSLREIIQLSKAKKILVFVNSRRKCDDLFLELRDLPPYQVYVHYSSLEKENREYVESHFKRSEFAICVATTTLELGIDIGSIECIVLYEPPTTVSSYLQRIGRGSRRAGKSWVVMTPKTGLELVQFCALSGLASENKIEELPSGQFYSTLVQQIFSSIGAKHHHRVHESEISQLCSFLPWVEADDIQTLLRRLSEQRYLLHEAAWSSYQMGPNLEPLYNETKIFSNIGDGESGMPVFCEGRRIASLPLPTNQIRLGASILFAGRFWEITTVGETRLTVRLSKPTSNPLRPSYGRGFGSVVPSIVSRRMRDILTGQKELVGCQMDEACTLQMKNMRISEERSSSKEVLLCVSHKDTYYYYTFAGGIENRILQLVLGAAGYHSQLLKNAEHCVLYSASPLNFNSIPEDQDKLKGLIEKAWESFAAIVNKGPFFGIMPASLRKKEVMSQIDDGRVLENVMQLRNIEQIQLSERPF